MKTPPQPERFRPVGPVYGAQFSNPPALRRHRYSGRRAEGVRYEKAGQEYLQEIYGDFYLASPWIKFFTNGEWRWCQPDGLLFQPLEGRIHIIEFKYQHTTDAWWQVRRLYQLVLRELFPSDAWDLQVCEIAKWFDPAVVYPERLVMAHEVHMNSPHFKVHIWKP